MKSDEQYPPRARHAFSPLRNVGGATHHLAWRRVLYDARELVFH
jgi:hypothetical protein